MKKLGILSIGIVVLLGMLLLTSNSSSRKTNVAKARATVKVVRTDMLSGGSGTIIDSRTGLSHVLTNAHVCDVARRGGFVVLDDGSKHPVHSYVKSRFHDVCLVNVLADLGQSTDVALLPPSPYSSATISGHPSLLPTIITTGHFSQYIMDKVLTGFRDCTAADFRGPYGFLCLFTGQVPILKEYEMHVVSATIKPGSSGSAVYDENGHIAALVFAGSGELGYAMTVPLAYIQLFLNFEAPYRKPTYPNPELSEQSTGKSVRTFCRKFRSIDYIDEICNEIDGYDN